MIGFGLNVRAVRATMASNKTRDTFICGWRNLHLSCPHEDLSVCTCILSTTTHFSFTKKETKMTLNYRAERNKDTTPTDLISFGVFRTVWPVQLCETLSARVSSTYSLWCDAHRKSSRSCSYRTTALARTCLLQWRGRTLAEFRWSMPAPLTPVAPTIRCQHVREEVWRQSYSQGWGFVSRSRNQ